ncbi:serine/threonine-protein kinase [Qingshengfaniella alkalisoli]|uniref:Serine/threonine protein kinase n=1 Tax=Qingshengfaniella alkalisoli TaxID=2599296 RepID=A0A5B8IZC0_9RHOB|nr:serine/threonine-protein kinase [Qingshengfaniella alkalisoli]QDY70913.1 serine/threonine protein kinase [Qingshengfaniella alkalisoli]
MTEPRDSDIFRAGDLLNNTYRIENILGRGGTSEVYKARSEISGREVALKVLKSEFASNEDFLVLMRREEEMREIRHDAVVRYSENQRTADGLIYLVMDYVEGPALDHRMRDGGMSAEDLITVAQRVTEGLRAAHSHNIFHRDLSPDNIILRGGDPADAVILDFGIAKDANPGAATIVGNEFAGKYSYAAPEQLSGQTDARSDLYSLGALLLATFRGQSPNVGANPMEVIQKKAQPLDTEGVPEPLKSLIDKLSNPDPAKRFQSAQEVLQEIDPEASEPTVRTTPPPKAPEPAVPAPPKSGRGALLGVIALVVLVAAAGGYWFLLRDTTPFVEDYTFTAEGDDNGRTLFTGHVPSESLQEQLRARAVATNGQADLSIAKGNISQDWEQSLLETLGDVEQLDEWQLSVDGDAFEVSGMTLDRALRDRLTSELEGTAAPGDMTGTVAISLGPRLLTQETLRTVLDAAADCGPLALQNPPEGGYPIGSTVTVTGMLAEPDSRATLYNALQAVSGDRAITLDAEVLSPQLCEIEHVLPALPAGDFGINFSFGESGEPNPNGRFLVGENPVIDVEIPADVTDGVIYVSVFDVSGNVYHLLPNVNRTENAVAELRGGEDGETPVRVAYPVSEGGNGKIAFLVDDTTLGKSKIVVLHANEPIFTDMRPTTESAAGYAQAVADVSQAMSVSIRSMSSRILTTALP